LKWLVAKRDSLTATVNIDETEISRRDAISPASKASGARVDFARPPLKRARLEYRRAGGDTHSRASFNTIHKDNDEQRPISLLSRSRACHVQFFYTLPDALSRARAVRAALKRRAPPSRCVLSV
jgi:hypothetical protein